jgi:hypothetical protein
VPVACGCASDPAARELPPAAQNSIGSNHAPADPQYKSHHSRRFCVPEHFGCAGVRQHQFKVLFENMPHWFPTNSCGLQSRGLPHARSTVELKQPCGRRSEVLRLIMPRLAHTANPGKKPVLVDIQARASCIHHIHGSSLQIIDGAGRKSRCRNLLTGLRNAKTLLATVQGARRITGPTILRVRSTKQKRRPPSRHRHHVTAALKIAHSQLPPKVWCDSQMGTILLHSAKASLHRKKCGYSAVPASSLSSNSITSGGKM